MKKDKKLIGVGLLTAIASSLCCITPVLALLSGTTGIAATFSWLEPARPYLIAITVLVLGFAWYQKLKPKKAIDCNCETEERTSFMQSKLFLGIVTVFALVMTAFPYYAEVFYPKSKAEISAVASEKISNVNLTIEGMTCTACETHINHAVNELNGIITVTASYETASAKISFDPSKTTAEQVENAINATGYTVKHTNKK